MEIEIPKDHHRFILGAKGKKLEGLQLASATQISLPAQKENSDIITIVGSKDGIERARHEIQCISDEQVRFCFFGMIERLLVNQFCLRFLFRLKILYRHLSTVFSSWHEFYCRRNWHPRD